MIHHETEYVEEQQEEEGEGGRGKGGESEAAMVVRKSQAGG